MPRSPAIVLSIVLLAAVGCASDDDGPRFEDRERHFSMPVLDGWTLTHERDTAVFYGPASDGLEQTSIAVRSVPREGDWVDERTPSLVTTATKTSVAGLPGAQLHGQTQLGANGMTGMQLEVSYSPLRAGGQRYERSHAVLIGDHRVFHILHTAPEGELDDTAALFARVVDGIREEN